MATNLFFLKGWTVTLIGALSALAAARSSPEYLFFSYFPVIIFWILDGYFLSRERRFRALYEEVRLYPEDDIDFSMDTEKYASTDKNKWNYSMLAGTILWFYLPLMATITVILISFIL